MSAQLSRLADAAQPTEFHRLLHTLNDGQRLLRVYTQNIDQLEEKVGLTYGIPDPHLLKPAKRGAPPKAERVARRQRELPTHDSIPRCIPLHGSIRFLVCQVCRYTLPLRLYIDSLESGVRPPCPSCTEEEETRRLDGKRPRGVGWLRPAIVLYNEHHQDDETIGRLVQRDLSKRRNGYKSSPVDLLLVVGTSLHVSGTKQIIRQFAGALHASRTSSRQSDVDPPRTIYLNFDFHGSSKEWEGVFDVWIRGDAQVLAQLVHAGRVEAANAMLHQ